ncbi:hypothetical protein DFJ77DRAFT_515574 [Powellomyces hirtus]|nr:hypothetical protein DFJ77DRAFT_515574 [Powellomyces hirtus]
MFPSSLSKNFALLLLAFLALSCLCHVDAAADSCNCPDAFSVSNVCYCGDQGAAVWSCIREKAPFWPNTNNPATASSACPDPVNDEAGFKKCVEDQLPKSLPDAGKIAAECVRTTKAIPSKAVRHVGDLGAAAVVVAAAAAAVACM